jgi:hypothetical protein
MTGIEIIDCVAPAYCRASMNYASASGGEPAPTEVVIYDGRRAPLPGWETCGFELMPHSSSVDDWDNDDVIRAEHYAEMAALAQRLTGCDHALVASHIKRNPEQAAQHGDLAPITFVHSDFALSYGDRIRSVYQNPKPDSKAALARAGISSAAFERARRILILQFWRNVGPAKMDLPLAFCDARTVRAEDVRPIPVTNYAGGGFDFDALAVLAPETATQHRWYVFPNLRRDEIVAFRTYDSERAARGEPFWTPHSAFADPDVARGLPSRRSIELRATCLFM